MIMGEEKRVAAFFSVSSLIFGDLRVIV